MIAPPPFANITITSCPDTLMVFRRAIQEPAEVYDKEILLPPFLNDPVNVREVCLSVV
jgi:hypothetical protein